MSRWPVGRTMHDSYTITVDPATPPGMYPLQIGFYSRARPLRLPVGETTVRARAIRIGYKESNESAATVSPVTSDHE